VENAPACHCQPGQNRPHRQGGICPGAIRAQDDQVKLVEKTSMGHYHRGRSNDADI
jgi:hypothetical protein